MFISIRGFCGTCETRQDIDKLMLHAIDITAAEYAPRIIEAIDEFENYQFPFDALYLTNDKIIAVESGIERIYEYSL